jgi:hypothetical protein
MDSQATRRPSTQPNPPGSHAPEDGQPDYVLWIYLGAESVFFYPPGSVQEHLVVEYGIPSVDMHWKVKGYYSHQGIITSSRACGRAPSAICSPSPMATSKPPDLGHIWGMFRRTTAVTNGSPRTVQSRR